MRAAIIILLLLLALALLSYRNQSRPIGRATAVHGPLVEAAIASV